MLTVATFETLPGRTDGTLLNRAKTVTDPAVEGSAPLTAAGLLMLAVLAVSLVGLAVDPRIVTGAPVWLKPAKFASRPRSTC